MAQKGQARMDSLFFRRALIPPPPVRRPFEFSILYFAVLRFSGFAVFRLYIKKVAWRARLPAQSVIQKITRLLLVFTGVAARRLQYRGLTVKFFIFIYVKCY